METKLYVGNLPEDTSADALRAHFAAVAAVDNVELVSDRSSGRMRGYAFVTMATSEAARVAINQLHGVAFEGKALRVNEAGDNHREDPRDKAAREAARVRISFQFRERDNMTYELDCAGTPLVLKMYPTELEGGAVSWRIDAKIGGETAASATSESRADALTAISAEWTGPTIDWREVTQLMRSVNAV